MSECVLPNSLLSSYHLNDGQYFEGLNASVYDTSRFKLSFIGILEQAFVNAKVVSTTFDPYLYPVDGPLKSMGYTVSAKGNTVYLTKALLAYCNKTASIPFNTALVTAGYPLVKIYPGLLSSTLIITIVTTQPTQYPVRRITIPSRRPTTSSASVSYANISVIQVNIVTSMCDLTDFGSALCCVLY